MRTDAVPALASSREIFRLAVDIGGTFTDLVGYDEGSGELIVGKESTTPKDFGKGVQDAILESTVDLAKVHEFVHGSTVIVNAIVERTGARTALLTTRGFRDVLEIGRANRPDMYNFSYEKPKPFVGRRHRFEVSERVDHEGAILQPLVEDDVRQAFRDCQAEGIRSAAVCYLHSYANPAHEQRTGEIAAEEFPEITYTLSHRLTKEWREYERSNTAVLNAYVQPLARRYLRSLEARLDAQGFRGSKFVMQSSGGIMTFRQARATPIQILESGPVGGVIGASALAKDLGIENVITLDIGGTTAKTSLIERGEVKINTEYRLEATRFFAGYPVKIPVVDIVEIGAGGGSIAWLDPGGSMKVGPRSAGAEPGPACYGTGGTDPTLTDANLLAGRINPENFLGGKIRLDVLQAERAIGELAEDLGLSMRETALGIIRIANNNMANALNMVSVRRGYDPRDFVLCAMGGGGGLHGAHLAEELRIRRVFIPEAPAHFSAWGMLMTDLRRDLVTTKVLGLRRDTLDVFRNILRGMTDEAVDAVQREGVPREETVLSYALDIRYEGQEHTVRVPIPSAALGGGALVTISDRFHDLHELHYTFRLPDPLEVVNLHVTAVGTLSNPPPRPAKVGRGSLEAARREAREVDFAEDGVLECAVYRRSHLPLGVVLEGPLVVEEAATTTLVYPDQRLKVVEDGNLWIETGA